MATTDDHRVADGRNGGHPRHRRVVVTGHGGPDVLEVVEEAVPEPREGEARVRVLAAGVSAFDLVYRRWRRLPGRPAVPFTLGEDVVGVVDAVATGVTGVDVGQMVAGPTWSLGVGGGYSEVVCLPATDLVPVPDGVDPALAVCVVVNYLTAHLHLHQYGSASRGERLLIHGAAGGVGTALVELARLAGLDTYGTAAARDQDFVAALGATPIDHEHEDFVARIRQLTGDGVDIVIDPVGGAMHLLRSYRVLRRGGRLVWLGSAATETQGLRVGPLSFAVTSALKLMPGRRRVPSCPIIDTYARANPGWYRPTLTGLLASVATGALTPVIGERIPLVEAARAHHVLESGSHRGKIVLVTDLGRDL